MTSSKVAKSDLTDMSDEALKDAIDQTVEQLNVYSTEASKRKREKYNLARKEYEVALQKMSEFDVVDFKMKDVRSPFDLLFANITKFPRIVN